MHALKYLTVTPTTLLRTYTMRQMYYSGDEAEALRCFQCVLALDSAHQNARHAVGVLGSQLAQATTRDAVMAAAREVSLFAARACAII